MNPKIFKDTKFNGKTAVNKTDNNHLKELIYNDLLLYHPSAIGEIHERLGKDIPRKRILKYLKT